MPDRSKLLLILCLASIITAGTAAASVLAQVVPVKMSVTARPGELTTQEVEIANQGDDPVVVRVTWSDWQLDEDGTLSLVPAGSTSNSLHGLVEFEPAEFSIGARTSRHVRVTLHMPADGPATRWGVMLSEVKPAALGGPAMGSRASAQLGTTFYLSRIPVQIVNAEVIGMGFKALGDSVAVSVQVRNAGERHYYLGGRVALRDTTGQAVAAGVLPNGVVLPGHTRTFQWICAASLLPGRYLATATLDTGAPELTVVEGHFEWPYLRARTLAVEQR